MLRTRPKLWRAEVYKLCDGICIGCGLVFDYPSDSGWEADHIVPLWWAYAHGDWSAWDPENGQLLCTDCHKIKTQSDYARFGRPGSPRPMSALD